MSIDHETKNWIRNASDERAAENGCRFDPERGQFVVDWIQRYCHLYEGDAAGELMRLMPWQLDATMRMFGWVRHSEEWSREVRRFRRASIWLPKKNGKSPTLAAWGLYLLAGDGELGQKVYSVAKDGKQAMIAHTHALEMIRRSPELDAECRINKSTSQIAHLPTSSVYRVVAGDNPKSQEGLNGSVMVDETHVVDAKLMKILKGAGISRSEPLHIEVSTAGNNPDGYGKQRFDRALQIEKAEPGFEDDETFVAIYAAPQDLADEQLEEDPVKWGKLANPAWGHTIKESEYLHDYRTAKVSLSDLLDFKMYRLNIWQRSANPWLKAGDWERCRLDFTDAELEGQTCWTALDLSRTRDMSSLVLCFPGEEEEEFKLLPYFWMPQDRAEQLKDKAPYFEWARRGFLELTPGGVTDYGYIQTRFRELCDKFCVQELAYDPRFAEEVTQAMSEGLTGPDGQTILEGTGVERWLFAQNDASFAAPTEDFERLVLAGKLRHNGHPVLSWQIGHAQVVRKPSKVKRVVKPSQDDYRTVDGVVAAIMALGRAMQSSESDSPTISWI